MRLPAFRGTMTNQCLFNHFALEKVEQHRVLSRVLRLEIALS